MKQNSNETLSKTSQQTSTACTPTTDNEEYLIPPRDLGLKDDGPK